MVVVFFRWGLNIFEGWFRVVQLFVFEVLSKGDVMGNICFCIAYQLFFGYQVGLYVSQSKVVFQVCLSGFILDSFWENEIGVFFCLKQFFQFEEEIQVGERSLLVFVLNVFWRNYVENEDFFEVLLDCEWVETGCFLVFVVY